MSAPDPIRLFHFTHHSHLPTIIAEGLRSDTVVQRGSDLLHEAGDPVIKDLRRKSEVDAGPGGSVAEYVPFYFAPRSPMLYKIKQGSVPSYTGSQHDLVYLCTTEAELRRHDIDLVATDRNAAAAYALFSDDRAEWDDLVDWPLMEATMWNNTPDDPDRMQRRMAECLAHPWVPWSAIVAVATKDRARAEAVTSTLTSAEASTRVIVRPTWYF